MKILKYDVGAYEKNVASFAEAWIENSVNSSRHTVGTWSPPSRRRGLKKEARKLKIGQKVVASFAEAWIENI